MPYPMKSQETRAKRSEYMNACPFADMTEAEDSFFIPMAMGKTPHTIKKKAARIRKRLKTSLDIYNELNGGEPLQIVVRTYLRGVRVWRR